MKIQCLAPMQTRLIGKWIYMEMLSGAKKVFTFLREIFVRQAEREKSLKSCWWFPGEVLVDRRGSFTRVENPGFCCISHPSPTHCTFSNGQSTIRFILFFLSLFGRKSSKVWKVINSRVFFFGMLYNVKNHVLMHGEMHTAHIYRWFWLDNFAHCKPNLLHICIEKKENSHVEPCKQWSTMSNFLKKKKPFPNPGTATPRPPAEIILMLCQILPEKSSYILKGRKLIIGIWGKTVASLGRVGGFIKAFMNAAQHRHRPPPSRSGCDFRPR